MGRREGRRKGEYAYVCVVCVSVSLVRVNGIESREPSRIKRKGETEERKWEEEQNIDESGAVVALRVHAAGPSVDRKRPSRDSNSRT